MAATLVWGDLDLRRCVGEGQAGTVWEATLRRPFRGLRKGDVVAVKRYKRWLLERAGQYERVFRELTLGMKVRHPNVVETYCLVTDPDGAPALVMRHYDGTTLEAWLDQFRRQGTVMDAEQAFLMLGAIALGLQALHAQGAIHRDVKPANIILTKSESKPVLMDLGVVTDTILPSHTTTDQFVGTIRYAHPLYLAGGKCGIESDAYSVGAVAYEMFFGRLFLDEDNWAKLVATIVSGNVLLTTDVAESCEKVHATHGIRVAEAAYAIVRLLLKKPTADSLRVVSDGIHKSFWQHHFYITENEIRLVTPNEFTKSRYDKEMLERQLRAINDPPAYGYGDWRDWEEMPEMRRDRVASLREYIRQNYWRWKCDLDDERHPEQWLKVGEYLASYYNIYVGDTSKATVRKFLDLYRYDLLTDPKPL